MTIYRFGLRTALRNWIRLWSRIVTTAGYCTVTLSYLILARVFNLKSFRHLKRDAAQFLQSCAAGEVNVSAWNLTRALDGALIRHARSHFGVADFARRLRDLNRSEPEILKVNSGPRQDGALRILYVTGMFPSTHHAGGLRLFDLISDQAQRFQVDLYSVVNAARDVDAFDSHWGDLNSIRVVAEELYSGADLVAWLNRRGLSLGHYDVVHLEYLSGAAMADDVRPFARKTVFTMQECVTKRAYMQVETTATGGSSFGTELRELVWLARAEKTALAGANASIAVTQGDAEFARRVFGQSSTVVPTGLSDFAVMQPLRESSHLGLAERPTALFLGYYGHYPNLEGLAWYLGEVHPLIRAKVPNYRLRVVGRGHLEALKSQYAADQTLDFVGEVDDIVPSIVTSWVCLAPLISGAGFRGKVNQYAIAGKPVVSTSIGADGLPYVDGQTIYVADRPEDFAAALEKIFLDYPQAIEVGKAAKSVAEKTFGWRGITPALESLYHEDIPPTVGGAK